MFDRLGVALYLAHQIMQALEALFDHPLALLHGAAGGAAGIGGLAGVGGHAGDGVFELAKGVANLCRVGQLALGAAVQALAQLGQGAAAASHLASMLVDGADQLDQVCTQSVQRILDVAHLAGACLQPDIGGEVAPCPGRQGRSQAREDMAHAPLDLVEEQCNQQDQANCQALHQAHFALDTRMLGAYLRFQRGQGLLQVIDPSGARAGQFGALADQRLGALQFGRIALEQAAQLALEGDALILGLLVFGAAVQAEHGGEAVAGVAALGDAE